MRCVALCTKLRRRRATSLAVASLLGVAGVSCSNDGEQAATSAADAESSQDAAPPTCGPDRVQKTVEAFVRALDSGDVGSADALVVTGPRFIGYGVNPERWGEDDGGRDSLASFFEHKSPTDTALNSTISPSTPISRRHAGRGSHSA